MKPTPSAKQLAAFNHSGKEGPAVLYYEFRHASWLDEDRSAAALARLATQYAGEMRWAGVVQQALIGNVSGDGAACMIHFRSRGDAKRFVESAEHAQALQACEALQVALLSEQPRLVALISTVLAKVLPRVKFDNTLDDSEEPETSTVIPTGAAIEGLKSHQQQETPVVMVNWLRFRPEARYVLSGEKVSGRDAYHRYGRTALLATHSLGAKLIFVARYQQMLVGNGGDPGTDLWNEFALMQYPGRAAFMRMTSLRRYRRALHHREAGLAEHGQGLSVTQPAPQFTWQPK